MADVSVFEDRYAGERLFIIGNGPSLNEAPLEDLNSEYTLAMNKISGFYGKTSWRPSFYCLFKDNALTPDEFDERNYVSDNIDLGIPCFLLDSYAERIGSSENVYYISSFELLHSNSPFHRATKEEVSEMDLDHLDEYWSDDLSKLVYMYHGMYPALQLASYMGFDEIYLLGCDLGLEYQKPHMIFEDGLDPYHYNNGKVSYFKEAKLEGVFTKSLVNGIAIKAIDNRWLNSLLEGYLQHKSASHFRMDYIPNLDVVDRRRHEREIIKAHTLAERISSDKGIEIYNATPGGELEVHKRTRLSNIEK